jgi:hypothetical protein
MDDAWKGQAELKRDSRSSWWTVAHDLGTRAARRLESALPHLVRHRQDGNAESVLLNTALL